MYDKCWRELERLSGVSFGLLEWKVAQTACREIMATVFLKNAMDTTCKVIIYLIIESDRSRVIQIFLELFFLDFSFLFCNVKCPDIMI